MSIQSLEFISLYLSRSGVPKVELFEAVVTLDLQLHTAALLGLQICLDFSSSWEKICFSENQ